MAISKMAEVNPYVNYEPGKSTETLDAGCGVMARKYGIPEVYKNKASMDVVIHRDGRVEPICPRAELVGGKWRCNLGEEFGCVLVKAAKLLLEEYPKTNSVV